MNDEDNIKESTWKKRYQDRKKVWKNAQSLATFSLEVQKESQDYEANALIRDGSLLRIDKNVDHSHSIPVQSHIRDDIPISAIEPSVNIASIIQKFNLNIEQQRAFTIVAQHSLQRGQDPLRMLIGGPGGTGKTRIIEALKHFFHSRNQFG